MGFTTTKAKRELARINKRLEVFRKLNQRREKLLAFLALGEQLAAKGKGKAKPEAVVSIQASGSKPRTAEVAANVLRRQGKMHLSDLIHRMRDAGWSGSGDEKKDKKAVYVAMLRMKDRFQKVGRNVWAAKEGEIRAAS